MFGNLKRSIERIWSHLEALRGRIEELEKDNHNRRRRELREDFRRKRKGEVEENKLMEYQTNRTKEGVPYRMEMMEQEDGGMKYRLLFEPKEGKCEEDIVMDAFGSDLVGTKFVTVGFDRQHEMKLITLNTDSEGRFIKQ
jgi:hypothetical protein